VLSIAETWEVVCGSCTDRLADLPSPAKDKGNADSFWNKAKSSGLQIIF